MSHPESIAATILSFIPGWENQDSKRVVAELISLSRETKREPDTYHFEVNDGVLIDPETQKPVLDFIHPGIEYSIARQLQSWADNNQEGLAFWVSPPLPGKYPCAKAIIHRIAYTLEGKKVVLNSAILFDATPDNPENLRKTLFTAEDREETIFEILKWVRDISKQEIENGSNFATIKEQAEYFAERMATGASPCSIIKEMKQIGFLGQNSISCSTSAGSPSFSEFILGRSNIISNPETGKFVKNCGNCGTPINTIISKGYTCPKCGGIYEGC